MAATIAIEDECGTFLGTVHTHNGYYAGDFSLDSSPASAESATTW
jgi:hypothetical protein